MALAYYLKEKNSDPPCYCPIDVTEEGDFSIALGLNYIGNSPPGTVIGEFWYTIDRVLQIELYEEYQCQSKQGEQETI